MQTCRNRTTADWSHTCKDGCSACSECFKLSECTQRIPVLSKLSQLQAELSYIAV